jgi:hypothetical protein
VSEWSLSVLLAGLHDDIQRKLETVRQSFGHPGTKGDASEKVWLELLETYLPKRYQAATAHVVDSKGVFSDQIDAVVFDRQYSPFIFHYQGQTIIPAESVYAVFEAKQAINAAQVEYAQKKAASVRRLHRTSLPIPHAGGTYPPKPLIPIRRGQAATGARRMGRARAKPIISASARTSDGFRKGSTHPTVCHGRACLIIGCGTGAGNSCSLLPNALARSPPGSRAGRWSRNASRGLPIRRGRVPVFS